MHFMKLYDHTYLGAWDLDEAPNKAATVTIEDIDKRPVFNVEKNKKESKPTLGFVGKKKRMVLNVTNARIIGELYGVHYKQWPGKRICITVARTRNGKDGIVVKPEIPRGKDTDERDMTHTGAQPEGTVTAPDGGSDGK